MIGNVLLTFRQRLAGGLSWSVLAGVSLQGSVLLSSVIVARILGVESFGAYAVLVATVMSIAAIAQAGSGLVALKFVAERLASDPRQVARVLRMCRNLTLATGLLAAVVMMAAAGPLSRDLLARPELELSVRLAALAVLFQVSIAYKFGALQGFGAFMELGRIGAIAGVAHIVLSAGGAWFGGLDGALLGFVAASAFRFAAFALLLAAVCRTHQIPELDRICPDEWRMVWRVGLPAGLAGLITMPCLWLVTVQVARLPEGMAIAALLTASHQVRLMLLQLPSLLNAVSFSVLSRLKGQRESAGVRDVFWSGLWLNLTYASFATLALVLAAEPVLRVYGRDFVAGKWVLVILLASVIPEMLAMTVYQLVQSAGRMWRSLFLIVVPRDVSYVALAAAVIPTSGAVGAAGAYLVAQAIGLGATLIAARQHAKVVWSHGA